MTEAVETDHPHIVRLDGVCGGEPVIDGLRVTVRPVATLHRRGETIVKITAEHLLVNRLHIRDRQCVVIGAYVGDQAIEVTRVQTADDNSDHRHFSLNTTDYKYPTAAICPCACVADNTNPTREFWCCAVLDLAPLGPQQISPGQRPGYLDAYNTPEP